MLGKAQVDEFAQLKMRRLILEFNRGICNNVMLKLVLKHDNYPKELLEQIVPFLSSFNAFVRAAAIRVYGRFAEDLTLLKRMANTEEEQIVQMALMDVAIERKNGDIIVGVSVKNELLVHRTLIELKRMGKTECYTYFLLNGNNEMIKLIRGLIESGAHEEIR